MHPRAVADELLTLATSDGTGTTARNRPPWKRSWLAAGLAFLVTLFAVGILAWSDVFSFVARKDADRWPGERAPGGRLPALDPDRRAAEWVPRSGGDVIVSAAKDEAPEVLVQSQGTLPAGSLRVILIDLTGTKKITNESLDALRGLESLRELRLIDIPAVTNDGLEHLKELKNLTRSTGPGRHASHQ